MLSADPVEILIRADAWGTRGILAACRGLTRDQFHHQFAIGPGSLHETLAHVVSTMRRWTDRLAGRTPRPVIRLLKDHPHLGGEDRDFSVAELAALLDDAERDLLETARAWHGRLDSTLTVDWPIEGEPGMLNRYTFSRAAVIVHVCTHGYHHRAQCLNMLRHLAVPGVSNKLPELDAVDWQAQNQSPPIRVRAGQG